jgi:hypothetical protein
MRTPAMAQPAQVKRRSEAIMRLMIREHGKNMRKRTFFFAKNPVAVFTHYSKLVEDHSLTRRQNRPQPPLIELLSEL